MRILLDTHILLWAAADTLPLQAAQLIQEADSKLFFSPVSLWEIVIKRALNRDDFVVDPHALYNGLIGAGYKELPLYGHHTLLVATLPPIHKDPFDRLMLAQASYEDLIFLTADKTLAKYPPTLVTVATI